MFDVVSVLQLPAFILHKVALLSGALHLALAECLVAVLSTVCVKLPACPRFQDIAWVLRVLSDASMLHCKRRPQVHCSVLVVIVISRACLLMKLLPAAQAWVEKEEWGMRQLPNPIQNMKIQSPGVFPTQPSPALILTGGRSHLWPDRLASRQRVLSVPNTARLFPRMLVAS